MNTVIRKRRLTKPVNWSVHRIADDGLVAPVAVTTIPIGASDDDCKRALKYAEGRYLLRALDVKNRLLLKVPCRLVVVTETEQTAYNVVFLAKTAVDFWRWLKAPANANAFAGWPFNLGSQSASTSAGTATASPSDGPQAKSPDESRQDPDPAQPSTAATAIPPAVVATAANRFGVGLDVTEAALRARRRKLARVHHPDANKHARATERMQAVNRDYDTLVAWARQRAATDAATI